MVILGLGSNTGDRLANLRHAWLQIKNIPGVTVKRVSPVYISAALLPEQAPTSWDMPFLNAAIGCDTTLTPSQLLTALKKIEQQLGRENAGHWAPRCLDIDILAWNDLELRDEHLTIPHAQLYERPFALWPLEDIAPRWINPAEGRTATQLVEKWGSRLTGDAPLHTRQIQQRIDAPQLVGIVNVTPDSFSDGGKFMSADNAIEHAINLIAAGAEIIDIGAESTAPGANALSAESEWQRLEPVLSGIKQRAGDFLIQPRISVDTRHAVTAKKALLAGANWINDVSGLEQPEMLDVLAQSDADFVMMHHVGIPAGKNHLSPHEDPVQCVYAWAEKQLAVIEQAGVSRNRIIVDPGIGFGKTRAQSLELIQRINVFADLGVRILVGHSRKLFLTLFTSLPPEERDVETLALSLFLLKQPVDYLRVHNVEMCARGMKVMLAASE